MSYKNANNPLVTYKNIHVVKVIRRKMDHRSLMDFENYIYEYFNKWFDSSNLANGEYSLGSDQRKEKRSSHLVEVVTGY